MRRTVLPCTRKLWRNSPSTRYLAQQLLRGSTTCQGCRRTARLLHSLSSYSSLTLTSAGPELRIARPHSRTFASSPAQSAANDSPDAENDSESATRLNAGDNEIKPQKEFSRNITAQGSRSMPLTDEELDELMNKPEKNLAPARKQSTTSDIPNRTTYVAFDPARDPARNPLDEEEMERDLAEFHEIEQAALEEPAEPVEPKITSLPFRRNKPRLLDEKGNEFGPITQHQKLTFDMPLNTFTINGGVLETLVPKQIDDGTPPNSFKDMLLTKGLGFFDRTQYLSLMAKGGYDVEMMYFRPEGFGKSTFADMVHFFNGKEYKGLHKWIFKGLDVHKKLYTGEGRGLIPGRFTVLRLDFSPLKDHELFRMVRDKEVASSQAGQKQYTELFKDVAAVVNRVLRKSIRRYFKTYPSEEREHPIAGRHFVCKWNHPVELIDEYIYSNIIKNRHNMYVIIEDYDWVVYAHQLYVKFGNRKAFNAMWDDRVKHHVRPLGDVLRLFNELTKAVEKKRPSIRYICTGTSPWDCLHLPTMQIQSKRSFDRTMSAPTTNLAGLRHEELELALWSIVRMRSPGVPAERCKKWVASHIAWMTALYGGYSMSDMVSQPLSLNTALCVRYLQRLLDFTRKRGDAGEALNLPSAEDIQRNWKSAIASVQGPPLPHSPNYNELVEIARTEKAKGPLNQQHMWVPFIQDKLKCLPPSMSMDHMDYMPLMDFLYFFESPTIEKRQQDDSLLHYQGMITINKGNRAFLKIPNFTALRGIEEIFKHTEDREKDKKAKKNKKKGKPAPEEPDSLTLWEQAESNKGFQDLIWGFLRSHSWREITNKHPTQIAKLFWAYLKSRHADHLYSRNYRIAQMESDGILAPSHSPYVVIYSDSKGKDKASFVHVLLFSYFDEAVEDGGKRSWTIMSELNKSRKETEALAERVRQQVERKGEKTARVVLHPVILLDHWRNKTVDADVRKADKLVMDELDRNLKVIAEERLRGFEQEEEVDPDTLPAYPEGEEIDEDEAAELSGEDFDGINEKEKIDGEEDLEDLAEGQFDRELDAELAEDYDDENLLEKVPLKDEEDLLNQDPVETSLSKDEETNAENIDDGVPAHKRIMAWTKPYLINESEKKKDKLTFATGVSKHDIQLQLQRYFQAYKEVAPEDDQEIKGRDPLSKASGKQPGQAKSKYSKKKGDEDDVSRREHELGDLEQPVPRKPQQLSEFLNEEMDWKRRSAQPMPKETSGGYEYKQLRARARKAGLAKPTDIRSRTKFNNVKDYDYWGLPNPSMASRNEERAMQKRNSPRHDRGNDTSQHQDRGLGRWLSGGNYGGNADPRGSGRSEEMHQRRGERDHSRRNVRPKGPGARPWKPHDNR